MLAREMDAEDWLKVTQAPVRAAQDRFTDSGVPKALMEPWNRRFSANGRPSQPESADKVTFMAKVCEEKAESLLKASGHNHVYLTPRDEHMQLCGTYAVVWMGESRHEVVRACMSVPEQLGLTYTRTRYGIRVAAAQYERLHAKLKPGIAVPSRIQVSSVYRLGPVPASAGPAQILEWAAQLQWPLRILKPAGHRHWQVGASSPPPANVLGWDDCVVLATPIEHGTKAPSVVRSGRLPRTDSKPDTPESKDGDGQDPWLHTDPWRQARAATRPTVAPTAEARAPTGPVEARLQTQDQRLTALEADLKSFRHEQQQQRQSDRAAFAKDLDDVKQQMQTASKEMSEQLRTSVQTLQDAQLRQQAQMQSSLEELKQLFMNPPTLPKKARREDEPHL